MHKVKVEPRKCQFVLIKGKRAGQVCGRPVWKKGGEGTIYCLPHMRQTHKDVHIGVEADIEALTEYIPINKPEEFPRTPQNLPEEEETSDFVTNSDVPAMEKEEGDDLISILTMLGEVRRNIKEQQK